ncbi:hemagglutinin repeat-containing protein [Pasteurella sp. PK-2025]|uniref:two-partner secretion domain-containing protein n=1 Tax=Pasteurella sp. PK-2025 TaxID=3413133 RepID=UPI003C72632C
MNKYCYRVIFSKTQQQFIVVSELAKTDGKAKVDVEIKTETGNNRRFSTWTALLSFGQSSRRLKPLSFALFCTLGFVSIQTVQANSPLIIQADASANAKARPQVMQSANGIPQVNIQTPNQQGMSYNRYAQFDVDKQGAILNNSRQDIQTQLGGWVQANPYLVGGEAKVIVNEVNSNKPSQLKGYVEVAGQKADVIIANPSGLHCEGCGVINANRATLTTGKPQFKEGHLDSFVVEKGKVTVTGKGMDNSQSDYTDIIAREAKIHAGVWSKKAVNVTTGQNNVSKNNDAVQILNSKSQQRQKAENAEYALDVSNLGGMYAEKIHLIGTEEGLGVRNAGHIGASAGDVVIDVNGKLVNSNQIQAQQQLKIKAKNRIENTNSGKLIAQQGNLELHTEKSLAQSGVVGAGQKIAVKAQQVIQDKEGQLQGADVHINAKGKVTNRGLINSRTDKPSDTASTVIKAKHIENIGTGRIYGDKVALGASTVENVDEINSENQQRQDPIIAAYERLDIAAEKIINKTGNYVATQKGAATLYSEKDMVFGGQLNAQNEAVGQADSLLNDSSTIEAANGNMTLNANDMKNLNSHFKAEVERQSDEKINETYVIPEGYVTKDRIDYNKLKWISFSRAGKLAFRGDSATPLKEGEEITSNTLLPTVNEYHCHDYHNPNTCQLKPESVYDNKNPAWAYFGITPPLEMPANLPKVDFPDEPIKPQEVAHPGRKRPFESLADYQQRLENYEKAKAQYDIALKIYETEKLSYEEQLAKYNKVMAPFSEWITKNDMAFDALNEKINQHNAGILGKTFSNFWMTYLNRRVKDLSVIKTTLPGQILAGGNILLNSKNSLNDRSQIIAGGRLTLNGVVNNIDETGYNILNEYGTSQYTISRWRGGFKRYHQRDWGGINSYDNYVNTPFQMGVAVKEENKNYKDNEATTSAKIDAKADMTSLPNSSLYKLNSNADSHVLIETDPAFADRKKWLSGDYMFNRIRSEHNQVHKRLGDGYYEQRLIREQINQLTGRQFLGNFKDMEEQYKALMDSGITFAKKFNLIPGVSLSAEQVEQLTSDIVWFENKTVILPDGSTSTVLAPKVYLSAQKEKLNGDAALLSGKQVVSLNDSVITNTGVITGSELVALQTENLENRGGNIIGQQVLLSAQKNIKNIDGYILAKDRLALQAKGDITHRSTTVESHTDGVNYEKTNVTLARKALLHVSGTGGELQVSGRNVQLQGADIINSGQGNTAVLAKNQLSLNAVEVVSDEKTGKGDHYRNERVQDIVISRVSGGGDVRLQANNLRAEAAQLDAEQKLIAMAENDLVLNAARKQLDYDEYHHMKSGSFISNTKKTRYDEIKEKTYQGTDLQAQNVILQAGKRLSAEALSVEAEQDIKLHAKEIELNTAKNQRNEIHWQETKKSGLGGSLKGGVASFGYQRSKAGSNASQQDENVLVTAFNAKENIEIVTEKDLNLQATHLKAEKNIHLQGTNVAINAVTESHDQHSNQYARSTGFGTSMVYNPLQVAKQNYQNLASQGATKGVVGKALSAVEAVDKAAGQTAKFISPYFNKQKTQSHKTGHEDIAITANLQAGQNLTVLATEKDIKTQGAMLSAEKEANLIAKGNVTLGVAENRQSQAADRKGKGISFDGKKTGLSQFGYYSQKEQGEGSIISEQGTVLSIGGKAKILAEQGDIHLIGAKVVAKENIDLQAGNDVKIETTVSKTQQQERSKSNGIGEAVISETERFYGYNRKLSNQSGDTITHQGSQLASLEGNIAISADNQFKQVSSELLAKEGLKIQAKSVDFDNVRDAQHFNAHQSDLKIGQFSRVKSPLIDLIQTAEALKDNSEASKRLQIAQGLSLAAQGYTLYDTALKTLTKTPTDATLLRVESGVGVSHSRQSEERNVYLSQGNRVNAKQIEIHATEGDLRAKHTQFSSYDEKGERQSGSRIQLKAKDNIVLLAGEDSQYNKGKSQNVGAEVGTALSFGAKTGWSFYARAGFGKQKQQGDGTYYQHTVLDSEQLNLQSGNDTTLIGTTAKGKRIEVNTGGNLHLESVQERSTYQQKGTSAGIEAEVGFGNSWNLQGHVGAERGESQYQQVREQTGLFAEEGSYQVNAANVYLKGAAIASTNGAESELKTNQLTFEDIQNHSSHRASSASLSGGYGKQADYYQDKDTGKVVDAKHPNAQFVEGKTGPSFTPSLPMHSEGSEESLTKATLTAGRITLNKDSQPIETTADALGINTDLSQAQREVSKPKDVTQLLAEQKVLSKSVGDIHKAISTYTANQQAEATEQVNQAKKALIQAEAEGKPTEIAEKQQALLKAEQNQAKWGDRGEYKRTAERLTTLFTGILANQGPTGIATQLASPEVNQWIKEATTNDKGETDKIANTLAHAIWGAIEATANQGNPTSGAIAAASAELAAPMLAKVLYNKDKAEQLTAEEKAQITALSSMTAAVAGGLTAQGSSQNNTTVSSLTHASIGGEIGKVAVENNYLTDKAIISWLNALENAKTEEEKENLIAKLVTVDDNFLIEALDTRVSKDELAKRKNALAILQQEKSCNTVCKSLSQQSIKQLDELLHHYDKWYQEKWENNRLNLVIGSTTLGLGSIIGPSIAKYVPKLVDKPVIIAGTFGGGTEITGQLIENKGDISKLDIPKIGLSIGTSILTKDMTPAKLAFTNASVEFLDAYRTDKESVYEGVSSGIASFSGAKIGSKVQNVLDLKFNPTANKYNFVQIAPGVPIYGQKSKNNIPAILGNGIDNLSNYNIKRQSDDIYDSILEGKDEKK